MATARMKVSQVGVNVALLLCGALLGYFARAPDVHRHIAGTGRKEPFSDLVQVPISLGTETESSRPHSEQLSAEVNAHAPIKKPSDVNEQRTPDVEQYSTTAINEPTVPQKSHENPGAPPTEQKEHRNQEENNFPASTEITKPPESADSSLGDSAQVKDEASQMIAKGRTPRSYRPSQNRVANTSRSSISRLKKRLFRELEKPEVRAMLFESVNEHTILSCCRESWTDFKYNNETFRADLERTLASLVAKNTTRNPIMFVSFRSWKFYLQQMHEFLNESEDLFQKHNKQLVIVSGAYARQGSPFYGCDRDKWSCSKGIDNKEWAERLMDHPRVKIWWMNNHESSFQHRKLNFLPLGVVEKCCLPLRRDKFLNAIGPAHRELAGELSEKNFDRDYASVSSESFFLSIGRHRNHTFSPKVRHREAVLENISSLYPNVRNQLDLGLEEYLVRAGRAPFVLSPRGVASDCYRHYEALMVGSVPLMDRHHTLEQIFRGLPVIFIDNWSDLTPQFLEERAEALYAHDDYQWEKLSNVFWKKKVLNSSLEDT